MGYFFYDAYIYIFLKIRNFDNFKKGYLCRNVEERPLRFFAFGSLFVPL